MTRTGKQLLTAAVFSCFAFFNAACAATGDSPTSPSPTPTPVINSLSPSAPIAASTSQIVTVTGSSFATGLSFILKGPDTGATLYGPSTISELTSTSFKATVTMPVAGAWTATVRASDGTDSSQFAFTVTGASAPPTNPQITAIGPAAIINGDAVQTVNITGVNFRSGLSLSVRNSLGVATTYNGASITSQTSTSFNAQVLLLTAGAYELTVTNADGTTSGVFSLIANPRPLVSTVKALGGGSVITKADGSQIIEITGLHFAAGLTYIVNGPATGAVAHGGADITDLTPTFFRAAARLHVEGDWTIEVINANGVRSALFTFRVTN